MQVCRLSILVAAAALAGGLPIASRAEEPEQTLSRATETESARTSRVIFVCPRDTLLTVEFVTSDPEKPAIVRLADGTQIRLPAKESGSGYRHADDTHELRGKGNEVTWTDGAKPPVVCTEEKPPVGGTEPR